MNFSKAVQLLVGASVPCIGNVSVAQNDTRAPMMVYDKTYFQAHMSR